MKQRKIGTIKCAGCGQVRDVIYPYSNSDSNIGIEDHEVPESMREPYHRRGEHVRCPHAGLTLKTDGKWLKSATHYYIDADITLEADDAAK